MKTKRKVTLVAATFTLTVFVFGITGCNTVAGVGKDIERAGTVVQDAAKKK